MQPDCLFSKSQKVSESSKSLNQPGANVFSSENLANRWTRVSTACPLHVRVRDFLKKSCPCPRFHKMPLLVFHV